MLDNNGMAIERLRKIQESNVYKASISPKVKDEFDDEREKGTFKKKLEKVNKKKIDVSAEKIVNNDDIIVDISLTRALQEQKIISNLVEEKFVQNPNLKSKIEFEDGMTIEERIFSLINDDVEDIEVKKSASEELLEQLERVIRKINE